MAKLSPHVKWIVIPVHLLGILALYQLFFHFAWWMLPAIWLGWFVTGCLGAEIGLHRLFSHNAFPLSSKPLRGFLGWAACMAGQWSPIWWVALHRGYHHPSSDTPRDIHSPIFGRWHAYMGWMFSLRETDVKLTYAKDLIRDPVQRYFHQHYRFVFWASMVMLTDIFGWHGFLIAVVIPVLLAMHQENIVNLFCHTTMPFGYRNFEVDDRSTNIYPLGLLFWGQGFHNNHHAKPNRYDFGIKPREIDVCRWVVPALMWLDRKLDGNN